MKKILILLKSMKILKKKLKPNEIIIVRVKRRNQELNRAIRTVSLEEFEKPKQKQPVKLGIRMKAYPLKGEELKIFSVQKKNQIVTKN